MAEHLSEISSRPPARAGQMGISIGFVTRQSGKIEVAVWLTRDSDSGPRSRVMNPTAAVKDDSCHQGTGMPDLAVGDRSVAGVVRYAKAVVDVMYM